MTSPWPQGEIPFAVDEILDEMRAVERDVMADLRPPDPVTVRALHTTITAYLLSLPVSIQDATAEKVIAALYGRRDYTASVAPRKAGTHRSGAPRTSTERVESASDSSGAGRKPTAAASGTTGEYPASGSASPPPGNGSLAL